MTNVLINEIDDPLQLARRCHQPILVAVVLRMRR